MKKYLKVLSLLLCVSMILGSMTSCGIVRKKKQDDSAQNETTTGEAHDADEASAAQSAAEGEVKFMERPSLSSGFDNSLYDPDLVPSVPDYSVNADFSNVINATFADNWSDDYKQKISQNLFVVRSESGREFYETYEFNSYAQEPNFVTVDSLMHTYHIYFAYLLKTTEKTYLSDALKSLSESMYTASLEQYDQCKGTEWESAALRNVEYFAVACELIGSSVDVPGSAKSIVDDEVSKIMDASGITESELTGLQEDYSQYKPRGYYEDNELLQKYFRTMMWYGRMTFSAEDEDMSKSAILMTVALRDNGQSDWNSIYAVTSFFAGASDDYGFCEYLPIINEAFGSDSNCDAIVGDKAGFDRFNSLISKLNPPQIQSIPVYEDEENVIPGFRFMGQRFTIDANIMQNLIYRAVRANSNDEQRMLPTVLDVPAALGSEMAEKIALEEGADRFPDYATNLAKLRADIESSPENMWSASLYAGWLNTLRPLLDEKGEGYPKFMQSDEWTKKTLETFAGSYTELKHDTVLYAKQPMAEMGGGGWDEVDDRGYVEPEPLVYARFASLADTTAEGLQSFGMISKDDVENLGLMRDLANKLLVISQKELRNELPTDEEFELIKNYGGNIEHFWYIAMKAEKNQEYITSEEYPAALVVDVATDPNGYVLEAGTGNPREIAVVVPVDGILRIAYGSVYNYYEFTWPLSDRLTDSKWREMIGAAPGAGYEYERDESMDNPEWTKSYRRRKEDVSWW